MVNGQKTVYMETWWAKGRGKRKVVRKFYWGYY
jgi:hypothetical protein